MSHTDALSPSTQDASFWLSHLEAWQKTGRSMAAYARAHGLSSGSFYSWKKRLRLEGRWKDEVVPDCKNGQESVKKPVFKRVSTYQEPKAPPPDISSDCRICLPNGVVIELSTALTPEALGCVMEAARRLV